MTPIGPIPGNAAALEARDLHSSMPGVEKIGTLHPGETTSRAGGVSGSDASFGSIVDRFVSGVDEQLHAAKSEQAKVLSGESTNLHQAMISMQEASVAFSLMIEVRNKLVESYQEIMRMQV